MKVMCFNYLFTLQMLIITEASSFTSRWTQSTSISPSNNWLRLYLKKNKTVTSQEMRCYQRYKTLRRDTVPSWAPRAKEFPVRQGTGHLHMRIPSQHSRRTRIHRATWSLPAPLSSLSTSVTSPSSCPCISVKNKGEKEVDESGKRREERQGKRLEEGREVLPEVSREFLQQNRQWSLLFWCPSLMKLPQQPKIVKKNKIKN